MYSRIMNSSGRILNELWPTRDTWLFASIRPHHPTSLRGELIS